VESSEWYCQTCGTGGSVVELIRQKDDWVPPPNVAAANGGRYKSRGKEQPIPSEATIQGWTSALLTLEDRLDWLIDKRMLTTDTIVQYGIGWDRDSRAYTIPIRDEHGELVNVRHYDPNPSSQRRKIWGLTGHNEVRLYPPEALAHKEVFLFMGEWDMFLARQNSINAFTRTGSEGVWQNQWSNQFRGKIVYIVADRDDDGLKGARKVALLLSKYAEAAYIIELPYRVEAKHGKDYTDMCIEFGPDRFWDLVPDDETGEPDAMLSLNGEGPELITVLDSFDSRRVGDPARLLVTIKGKQEPGYTIPKTIALSCTQDAGDKCVHCTLNGAQGHDELPIEADDPIVLELIDSSITHVHGTVARNYGIPGGKCNRLQIEATSFQSVEILHARPSIDHADGSRAGDYKNIKITSVGRHDTMTNNTVEALGALYPNPLNQKNEWLAHRIERQQTSVDRFDLTPEAIKLMKIFQTQGRPLRKVADICKELSLNVTKIYGRPEMHALMDLTFHSVLSWHFDGDLQHRGWLEALVLGDTRTGKSEAGARLVRYYGVGEVVGGESASIAGLLGGLQTFGGGKEWTVTWGAIPINNKRLVVIDEASGLSKDDIGKMSSARSDGVVKIQKVQQDVALAMTRLLWLSNPRDAKMADFTYGIQAVFDLIGRNEDIARFDLMMCVALPDVPDHEINKPHPTIPVKYSSTACNTLIRWVWTRQSEQVIWAPGAQEAVYSGALEMGRRYVEEPPLVHHSNVRMKIARVSVALAARLFSTDETYENVVVKPEHVQDAIAFMDRVYNMKPMGYAERSREIIADREEARKNYDDVKIYLHGRPGLAKFLKGTGSFRRQDIEEVLNTDRSDANSVVNTLLNARMVRKQGADVRVEPTLHELLREVRG